MKPKSDSIRVWRTHDMEDLVLTRGEGCRVWDGSGKSYLDLLSGTWSSVLGHGHPRWTSAIGEQASKLVHTAPSFTGEEVRDALHKLGEILPPQLNRAVLLNTGSESVELALKMARAASDAGTLVVMERGYYGATTYALSLSEAGRHAPYLPPFENVIRLPAPECRKCPVDTSWPCGPYPCLDRLRDLAGKGNPAVAAVVYEPVLANGGVMVPPAGYGFQLRSLASDCGAIFIAEEVTTGMGRTGRWFGFEHEQIVPDILVLGKALGAGLPVSAVVTTDAVEVGCRGVLTHVQSHQNDPFSGRIVATVISILQDEGLVDSAARAGHYFLEGLKKLQLTHPCITDVRGKGAMLGIELQSDRAGDGLKMARRLQDAGFILNYQQQNATFRMFPPYCISRPEIDSFLHAFEEILGVAKK